MRSSPILILLLLFLGALVFTLGRYSKPEIAHPPQSTVSQGEPASEHPTEPANAITDSDESRQHRESVELFRLETEEKAAEAEYQALLAAQA
jgi:hypothetical protein